VTDAEPTIVGATFAAGHDGRAEVAIDVRYATGATRTAVYSYEAIAAALDAGGVERLEELIGRPWTFLLTAHQPRREETKCSI
jgi:hypothetical protein